MNTQYCSGCKKRIPKTSKRRYCSKCTKQRDHPKKAHYTKWRKRASSVFDHECECGYKKHQRMRPVPVTHDAKGMHKQLRMVDIYMLPDEVLLSNFEGLCPNCYVVWLEEEAGLCEIRTIATTPRLLKE